MISLLSSSLLLGAVSEKELTALTMDMIGIPSYPGIENQETGVARYIHSFFRREGIPCELTEVEDGRYNVQAVLKGTGGGKTLLFNGHTDTVAPNGMERALEPFVQNGLIYGRGASDMKGPIACVMAAMAAIVRLKLTHAGDIIFTGVLDEERMSIGTIDLIERGVKADCAIVCEPTALDICTAHRGLEWYCFDFIGRAVHGGRQKEGVNAISKAVKFVNEIEQTLVPELQAKKHPVLGEATVNVGVISGGTQLSTVAGNCRVYVDRRFLPYETIEDVEIGFRKIIDKLSASDSDFKCVMRVMDESRMKQGYIHMPMEIDPSHEIVGVAKDGISHALGREPRLSFFPAWTDGALLEKYAGIPSIVLGPGEIEECHSDRENISIKSLREGYLSYAMIALDYCK